MARPNVNKPRRLGKFSEHFAAWVYRCKGYRVLDRNWTKRWAELDLVVVKKTSLVIIEVRSRSSKGLINALESFDQGKRRRFMRAARLYLYVYKQVPHDVTLELFCISWFLIIPVWKVVSLPNFDAHRHEWRHPKP